MSKSLNAYILRFVPRENRFGAQFVAFSFLKCYAILDFLIGGRQCSKKEPLFESVVVLIL